MRRIVLGFTSIAIILLAAQQSPAQMCQGRGGMSRGMTPMSAGAAFFSPAYSNFYPNYYPSYYPYNYPAYYPGYLGNAAATTAIYSGASLSQSGEAELANRDTASKAKARLRASDPKAKAKAEKLIAAGDEAFARSKYSSAVEQYRSAARAAPDLAEPPLRQALTLVAQKRYPAAVKAFRRGLELRHDWSDSPLRLDQLYADGVLAKANQSLTKALDARPGDSDLLIASGMQLYFDGERDRAGTYFARAAGLGANRDRLLDDFLPSTKLGDASRDKR